MVYLTHMAVSNYCTSNFRGFSVFFWSLQTLNVRAAHKLANKVTN